MAVKFKSQFDPHERVISPAGEAVKDEFVGRYNKDGVIELVPNGQTDMYSFIQSHADSVDIYVLLNRYKNGDVAALERVQAVYADVTNMPRNMAELLNLVADGERTFMGLDVNVREQFNNSISEWLASAGSPEWFSKMGLAVSDDGEVVRSVPVSEPVSVSSSEEVKG